MRRLVSWRLALRVARREALRAKGRSILVLVMIALPVLAVTAADVVLQTQDVSSAESLGRRIGAAAAQVTVPAQGRPVLQGVDPDQTSTSTGRQQPAPTAAELAAALGGARLVAEREGQVRFSADHGSGYAEALEVDLRDPVAAGLVRLTSGRLPSAPDEVVVNQPVLDEGYAIGDTLDLRGRRATEPVIVGVAESPSSRTFPFAAGPVGSLGLTTGSTGGPRWLAEGDPVSWDTVRELNAMGATVLSRAVVEDPPPASEIPEQIRQWSTGTDDAVVAAAVLIVVMALLEVVLLAGPAFAVSARRLSRSLALMAATGGTPAQSRRVVLAGGLVLGGVAAAVGVLLGIGAGRVLVPLAQQRSDSWFGPFEVPWVHLLGIAAFGLLSAVLAAVVPAWIASRQDVVAVLAGRRADRAPSLRSPILGVVLLGVGIAGSAYGAKTGADGVDGAYVIAGSAVVAVLGMILLVPIVVVGVARLSGRLPLSPRYAARDAARHRSRTVPAVAAVAATVAGVVALGIAVTSDEAENEQTYEASLPMGVASVSDYGRGQHWDELRSTVERQVSGADVTTVAGVPDRRSWTELTARRDGVDLGLDSYGGSLDSALLVDDGRSVARLPGVPSGEVPAARRVLGSGGAVVFTNQDAGPGRGRLVAVSHPLRGPATRAAADLPVLAVHVEPNSVGARAVLSPDAAEALELPADTVGLLFDGGDLTTAQTQDLTEALVDVSPNVSLYVERGYQTDQETLIVQLVLAGLGAVLMLGGTLTATFLALSDARPDLATLSAVGASPRRRRGIAASYALVVGFVGALLGAAVGFIPGIAITYPLTAPSYSDTGPFLDVPWLLVIGLVVGLPLLTAAIVGLTARSRLPLVARLD